MTEPKHPRQPVVIDKHGTVRFKRNAIVEDALCGDKRLDLNVVAVGVAKGRYTVEDYTQAMQLLGYSVSGAADLREFDSKVLEEAEAEVEALLKEPR